MNNEKSSSEKDCQDRTRMGRRRGPIGVSDAAFFVVFIGAAVYFIQKANSFWMGVLGFLKACVET